MNNESIHKLHDVLFNKREPDVTDCLCMLCKTALEYDCKNRYCPKCGRVYEQGFVLDYNDYNRYTKYRKSTYKKQNYLKKVLLKYHINRDFWDRIEFTFSQIVKIFEFGCYARKYMISYNIAIRGILLKFHEYKEANKIPLLKTKKNRMDQCKLFYELWNKME